ncbi:MAG: hypothetical protein ACLUTA_16370 [Blautia wexlerae]
MVVTDARSNPEQDDVEAQLNAGVITIGELSEMPGIFWDSY